jgi:hypothetical protein
MGLSLNCQLIAPYDRWAPIISGVSSGTPGPTTATITWTTNELADSQIEYGLTTSYGSTYPSSPQDTSPRVTSHSVNLSGLTLGLQYHFRIKSRDTTGNLAISIDYSFYTTGSTSISWPAVSGAVGYKVYSSPTAGYWSSVQNVGNILSIPTSSLPVGTHFVAVTSYNSLGVESAFSNMMAI